MRKEIETMGLKKFRAMSDREAKDFYYGVVERYGISERGIEAAAKHSVAPLQEKTVLAAAAQADPELKRSFDFINAITDKTPEPAADVLTEEEKPLKAQIDRWDAMKILQDKAFAMSGRITPETLVKAYGALATELHHKMDAEPGNRMYNLQMTKLQSRFIEGVKEIDYVEVNRQRGVKIENVEPSLSRFTQPARTVEVETEKPSAPKKPQGFKL
jgi:hypothetical protein